MTVATTKAEPVAYTDPLAWCPLAYTSLDGAEHEIIWNARDGEAPYQILLPSGREGIHAGADGEGGRRVGGWTWSFSRRDPRRKLLPGELYFTGPPGGAAVLAVADEPVSQLELAALRAVRDADQ